MSYTRGDVYVFRSVTEIADAPDKEAEILQIWSQDGGVNLDDIPWKRNPAAVGIAMPMELFDEVVAMRAAQLLSEGRWDETALRAIEHWSGNFGCAELIRFQQRRPANDDQDSESTGET